MKKLLFVALAAVGMAACVQTEELSVANNNEAIAFDTFVENATKASAYDSSNLDHFNVYGTISQNGTVVTNIFDGVPVNKNSAGAWTYSSEYTQYWIPGFHYDFAAVVDGTVVKNSNNMPESIEVDMTEQEDVLYATVGRYFGANDVAAKVGFTFNHLLAKAQFTVKNTISAGQNFVYNVESIKIKNADKNGAYDVATGVWAADDTYEADFGVAAAVAQGANTVGSEVLLVPGTKELAIAIKYNLTYNGAELVNTTKNLTAVLTLEQGKAYNFVVEFGNPGEEIEFNAEVKDWVEDANLPVYEGGVALVSSVADLQAALNYEGVATVVLKNDIDLADLLSRAADPSLKIKAGKELTLDLNGKKLSATSTQKGKNYNMFDVLGTLTIKNGTIDYIHAGENMEWSASTNIFNVTAGGVLNLEGVTAKNLGGSDMAFVAHLNNWGEATLNVENSTLESPYVAVRVFNSGYDKNNVTIKNSTLKGKFCYWVHNYTVADFGSEAKAEAQKALLNVDIYGNGNTFEYTGNAAARYGFTNSIYEVPVKNADELNAAIEAGYQVALDGDVVLENGVTIANGKNVVLNLYGNTISAVDNATGNYGLITNKGNLTVVGPGKLQLSATNDRDWNAYSSVISNTVGGNLVVDGGVVIEHLGGTDMAYGIDNLTNGKGTSAVVTVKDATVKSTYRAIRQFLNGVEATNELNVEAGAVVVGANKSIWMQDPSAKANTGKLVVEEGAKLQGDVYLYVCEGSTEWPVEVSIASAALDGESTVLTGNVPVQYQVVEENGVWTVIEQLVAATTADLQTALAEGKDVVLANNLTITPEEMPTAPYGNKMALNHNGGVFNGNGKTIGATIGGDNYVVMTNGGTIKNLNINNGFRGVVIMYANQTINLDNVVVSGQGVCYALNTAEGDSTQDLVATNCTFDGWSSWSLLKSAKFTNCTFGQGQYYTNVYGRLGKPYVTTLFDGCEFGSKFYIDLSSLGANQVVTLKNCTVNGVKLTAENWASLIAPEDTCGEGQISVELKNGTYLTAENVADYIVIE